MSMFYYIRIMEQIVFCSDLQARLELKYNTALYSIMLSAPQEGHTTFTGDASAEGGICIVSPQAGHVLYSPYWSDCTRDVGCVRCGYWTGEGGRIDCG